MKNLILISGGGTGIGFEIAKLACAENQTPVLFGRRREVLESASAELGGCPFFATDLSDANCKKKLDSFLKGLEGCIVGVVNNAGVYRPSSLEESDEQNWLDQYKINVLSALNLSQVALPYLKKHKGSVVNISSTLGERPIPNAGAYSASKAAMNSMTLSMAMELAPYSVRVNAICPGIVDTPIHDQHRTDAKEWKTMLKDMQPLGRVGSTKDIAPMVLCLLDNSKSAWTTGALINIDGGILLKS